MIESYQGMVKRRGRKISSCSVPITAAPLCGGRGWENYCDLNWEVMENIMKALTKLQRPSICRDGRICWRETHSYSSINQDVMAQWPNSSNSWVKGTAQTHKATSCGSRGTFPQIFTNICSLFFCTASDLLVKILTWTNELNCRLFRANITLISSGLSVTT